MTCIDEGQLRARIDGELDEAAAAAVDAHLNACANCRALAEQVTARAGEARSAMAALASPPAVLEEAAARAGYARFQARRLAAAERVAPWRRIISIKPVWATAACAALAVAFSFAPVRGAAQRMLALFRVQKFTVVPIDPTLMNQNGSNRAGEMLARVMSDKVVVTTHSGAPVTATNAAAASQQVGFRVRLLSARKDTPQLMVKGAEGFQMTLDRDRLQAILTEAGRNDLQLPAAIDGALVAVHVPAGAIALYGHCPQPRSHVEGAAASKEEAFGRVAEFSDCVMLHEFPSPTVSMPPDLNIAQLAAIGLEFAGMSRTEAEAFCNTVDWTSTIVIPLPRNMSHYQTVDVDGAQGLLIGVDANAKHPAGFALMWVKNGIIYALNGFGDSREAMSLAGSLE